MRAVILVGGFGTRLRPLTLTTPKQMLPIVGIPQLERKIAHLAKYGVDDIVLSMGYKPDAFMAVYPDNQCAGAALHYVVEDEPLGTAGAIAFAARQAGIDETFLAMNGDVLTDLDVDALKSFHQGHGAQGTIALTPVEDPSRFGVVVTEPDGRVTAFVEKPPREEAPTNRINAGTYIFEPSFLDLVPEGENISIERVTFPQMVANSTLFADCFSEYWIDIGTPDAYIQGNLDELDHLALGRSIKPTAHVDASAVIERSVVGEDVVIEAEAEIRESIVLDGAVVRAGARIEHSVVAERAVIGANAQVLASSVVGAETTIEANAKLAGEKVPS